MTEITKDRYATLRDWFEREGATFTSETALTVAAVADVQASGSEVDMVAMWWREKFREPAEIAGQATLDEIEAEFEDDPAAPVESEPAADRLGAGTGSVEGTLGSTERPPEGGSGPAAALVPLSTSIAEREFELDQRRAKAYALSGYWPDAQSLAQALVKIEAGRELGLPALVAMNEVHVIDGKPGLGAAAQAAFVKRSGRYDYRVLELTNERCTIAFVERKGGALLGESVFTIEDADRAGLTKKKGIAWHAYPRNMLYARAMTNGVAWFCPDVLGGRFYDPEELEVEDEDATAA